MNRFIGALLCAATPLGFLTACSAETPKTAPQSVIQEAPQRIDPSTGPERRFARLALDCVHREYPNKISHVMTGDQDAQPPRQLHPAFYGCFDWHSSVHGHWLLLRLLKLNKAPDVNDEIIAKLSTSFTDENITAEVAYFTGPDRASYERPYGTAWFLQLMAELEEWPPESPHYTLAKSWQKTLKPLETTIADATKSWLPKLAYPIRLGTHNQSMFAFGLMLDWARTTDNTALEALLVEKSSAFHDQDQNCPLAYEPSGEDFLSPCLMEADLMRRIYTQEEFAEWLTRFLPQIPTDGSADWLKPGIVTDPSDGKLVHLDGVNLSRAWALQGIAAALPPEDTRIASLNAAADIHKTVGIAAVSDQHYSGSHWLASFATYLTTQRGITEN